MTERSLGGVRYFITFVDDCTHKVWAYLIKSKDETLEAFSRWMAEVENRSDYKVNIFWLDNGGEYTSKAFVKYLSESGCSPWMSCSCWG